MPKQFPGKILQKAKLLMPKVNIVMDMSQYDMFRLCEQRYDYRYNKNKTLPDKAKPLDRGTLVHLICEIYYEQLKIGTKYQDAVNLALSKAKIFGAVSTGLEPEIINRVIEVMEEYFDHWRVADQCFQIVEVEQAFMYLLYEDDEVRIHLAGKIDLIISDNRYINMPWDHKSYDRSFEVGRMPNQFKNYCYATKSNYLLVNKIGFQKTLKPHEKFLRIPLSYDHLILEEWKANVVKVIFHYLNCVAENSWPMNETSCDKFNRRCEYYEICDSSGGEAKLYKLAANYIDVEPWDVSKALRKSSEVAKEVEGGQQIQDR